MLRLAALVLSSLTTLAITLSSVAATPPKDKARDRTPPRALEPSDLSALSWRSVGPANMGGRIAAIALAPNNPKTYYIGYATGGVWKTTNRGTTFTPVFDEYETSSIGALAVCDAPKNWKGWKHEKTEKNADLATLGKAKIVWVGTGEGNGRNSSSWGHGVYRSTDAGASFTHLGLADAHDIPALAVHPDNPDVCYVAALGHLWGPNKTRGIYKTTDGGKTWKPSLRINENIGACDVKLDPKNPKIVYAAMYQRRRAAWSFNGMSTEAGIFRSDNGGNSWTRLTKGLPTRTGRIGLAVSEIDPKTVYAIVESDDGGQIVDAWHNRSRGGGVFRSTDRGNTWERLGDFNPRAFYFSRIYLDPKDANRVYVIGWELYISDDGGRTFRAGAGKVMHVDYHAMVIDPTDHDHLFIGNDGGLYESWDRGKTWDFHNHMAVGQFYNVSVDHSDPYRVGGGLQDNGTWIGPSETITKDEGEWMGRAAGITNRDWQSVNGGDGFHLAFDPLDPNIVYAEWQGGNISRIHLDTGEYRNLKPAAKEGEPRFRFNWNAPFFVSPHEPTTLYFAGNHVFRLTNRGEAWEAISDDLSTQVLEKVITEGSEAETHGTVVSLAESTLKKGLLWAGTDDGLIHVTWDGGKTWKDVTPDAVEGLYVSKIELSYHDEKTAYAAIDGHRSDVMTPLILMTTNGGGSWTSVTGDLPDGAPVKVVRADPTNPEVLYAGTERASYVTINGGAQWVRLNGKSLPTVAVDDLKIQTREHDLVAGTHGRSIWILDDVSPIAQLTPEVLDAPLHAFRTQPGKPRYYLPYDGIWSDRMFSVANPPMGAAIHFWLREYTDDEVKISITRQGEDHVIRELKAPSRRGINRVMWDLQAESSQQIGNPHEMPEFVPAGTYAVTITCGDLKAKTTVEVLAAPGVE